MHRTPVALIVVTLLAACDAQLARHRAPSPQDLSYLPLAGHDGALPAPDSEPNDPGPGDLGPGDSGLVPDDLSPGADGAVGQSGFVKVAAPQCLSTMPNKIKVPAGVKIGYSGNPAPNTVVDMSGVTVKFAPPGESGWVVSGSDNVCVVGGKFVGQSSKSITWKESKAKYDGSGLRVNNLKGTFTWENVILDNSHDGIMLPRSPDKTPNSAKGVVRGVYLKYTRDDCFENDSSTTVVADDALMECHMFFSARNNTVGDAGAGSSATIRNVLVHMTCKPDDRTDKSCGPTDSHAQIWKLGESSSKYKIHVEDSIFMVESLSRNGAKTMRLNMNGNITYKNVTVVWGGQGNWPGPDKPPGITFTKDRNIWDAARAEWLAKHGCDSNGDDCTFK
jgi:hypothetical protein